MKSGFFRWAAVLVAVLVLTGCADSKAVNAAFARTRVSWFVFDTARPDGLRPLTGFDQPLKVTWVPRTKAVRATDLTTPPGAPGAVAVSRLGLLVLDDSDGILRASRPGASMPLAGYNTDRFFVWKGKLFLTLTQEPPVTLPPATLAWWAPGQNRMAFFPVPSQIKDPSRQAAGFRFPGGGTSLVTIVWKTPAKVGWAFDATMVALDGGSENPAPVPPKMTGSDLPGNVIYGIMKMRLADRIGAGVPVKAVTGNGYPLIFTESGWVAVGREGDPDARLYRLPDLGATGRYTGALVLSKGFVFTWEASYRGYSGASGLVHVPFGVLAP